MTITTPSKASSARLNQTQTDHRNNAGTLGANVAQVANSEHFMQSRAANANFLSFASSKTRFQPSWDLSSIGATPASTSVVLSILSPSLTRRSSQRTLSNVTRASSLRRNYSLRSTSREDPVSGNISQGQSMRLVHYEGCFVDSAIFSSLGWVPDALHAIDQDWSATDKMKYIVKSLIPLLINKIEIDENTNKHLSLLNYFIFKANTTINKLLEQKLAVYCEPLSTEDKNKFNHYFKYQIKENLFFNLAYWLIDDASFNQIKTNRAQIIKQNCALHQCNENGKDKVVFEPTPETFIEQLESCLKSGLSDCIQGYVEKIRPQQVKAEREAFFSSFNAVLNNEISQYNLDHRLVFSRDAKLITMQLVENKIEQLVNALRLDDWNK